MKRKQLYAEVHHEAPLHVKYRPKALEEVLGQDAVIASVTAMLRSASRPHSFLLTGPSGTGKTTIARILARQMGCEEGAGGILEADAATNTGIDAMRAITDTLKYRGFGDQPNRMIIIDECHALSKAAWQSLLKSVEEPPEHIFFCFCTTDAGKVPDTIKTRCVSYNLKALRTTDVLDLVEFVAEQEQYATPPEILGMVARASEGSPRRALVMLAAVHDCEDKEEAAIVLEQPLEDKETIDLIRALVGGKVSWSGVLPLIKAVADQNAEGIRITMVNYLNSCILGARSEQEAVRLLGMLDVFSTPCNPSDKIAPILLAVGRILYSE